MPNRGLLVAVALLAVLAGGIYWSNQDEEKKVGAPAKDAPPKILEIPEDQFVRIEIKRRDGTGAVLERQASGWRLTAPKALPADTRAVQTLVSALALVASERLVDEKPGDLMQYGFASPQVEVLIARKDGKKHKLLLGEASPLGTSVFARIDGDARLYTVGSATKAAVDKVWQDLRDRRLLTFYDAKLVRVELNGMEFVKAGGHWSMTKPQAWRPDTFAVEELVRKMIEAKMEITPEDEELTFAGKFASAAPYSIVRATDDQATQQLDIRKDKEGNFYAKSTAVEGFFKLPPEAVDTFAKKAEAFRSKKLFDFGFAEPSKVGLKHDSTTWTFAKTGADWLSAGKKIEPGSVQQLVDRLRELAATGFVPKGGGKPLAEYSITLPGKSTEVVSVSQQGDAYFATRAGDPTVYAVDGKVVEELHQLAASAKPLP